MRKVDGREVAKIVEGINEAVEEYNEMLGVLRVMLKALNPLAEAANSRINEFVCSYLMPNADMMSDYYSDQPENWKGSKEGLAYRKWALQWQKLAFEQANLPTPPQEQKAPSDLPLVDLNSLPSYRPDD